MSGTQVRVLGFVNHVAHAADVEQSLAQALEWGVDVIVAQGTGSDWGPYWLGSGSALATDLKNNVRPYLRVAVENDIPFVLSVGIAGARAHLERCLELLDELCVEEGWNLRLGVIDTEIDTEQLAGLIEEGRTVRRCADVPDLSEQLSAEEARGLTRAVGLVGPEPIMDLLASGEVQGVVTGRALDIALYMAPLMQRGIPRAVAAHAGKLLECAGVALDPTDVAQCVWACVDEEGVEVRSPNPRFRATIHSLASHSFYERSDPTKEDNPGGCLDLGAAVYQELPSGGIRCTGARWIDAPYTVLVEGARLIGYRTIVVMGARDPALLAQLDTWIEQMRRDVAAAPRFADLQPGEDYRITVRQYGRSGVLQDLEPLAADPGHEVGVILDVVASTQDLASEIAYFAFIRMFIGPYPGRKTTAGNVALPFMPLTIPVGETYAFGAYHLLPLQEPSEVFHCRTMTLGEKVLV